MREVKPIKKKKNIRNFLLLVAIVVFCLYMLAAIISQQLQIKNQKAKLQSIRQEIQVQEIKNSDVRHELENEGQSSEYIARIARESLNMAKTGERIFICPGGD